MRENDHNNRRKTGTGSNGPARTGPQVYTAGQREAIRRGLRILARIIARAHLRRQASRAAQQPAGPPQGRGTGG